MKSFFPSQVTFFLPGEIAMPTRFDPIFVVPGYQEYRGSDHRDEQEESGAQCLWQMNFPWDFLWANCSRCGHLPWFPNWWVVHKIIMLREGILWYFMVFHGILWYFHHMSAN